MADSLPGHGVRLCGARRRQGDGTCAKQAGWGTHHLGEGPCRLHGGSTPSVSKGANLRLVQREALELFGKVYDAPTPVDNPLAAYAELAGEVMAWKNLMHTLLEDVRAVGFESDYAGVQINAAVQLYERAMDRANTVLSSYARLKIDERLAAITEAQKNAVIRAINAALDAAGLQGDARADATKAAARHLRAVA